VLLCVLAAALVVFTEQPSGELTSAPPATPGGATGSTSAGAGSAVAQANNATAMPLAVACTPEAVLLPDPDATTASLGTALVRQGTEYRLVSLDRPEFSRRIASCTGRAAIGAAFAGTTGTGASTAIYLTTHHAIPDGITELHRFPLTGGPTETVLAYAGRADEVAVSPDGRAAAYVNRTGLRLRDLATQVDRLLQRHVLFCPASHRDCYMNSAPVWSSNGRYIAYFEYHGEAGGTTQLIEPAVTPSAKVEVVTGGLTPAAWSPRNQTLCGLGGYGAFDGGFFDVPDGRARPVGVPDVATEGPSEGLGMTSCVWADDGRVAVSYAPRAARGRQEEPFVALLSPDLQLERRAATASVPLAWTADGHAVVLAERRPQQAPRYSLLYTDGNIVPLALQADALLALIAGDQRQ
jgi:hypothetical protein